LETGKPRKSAMTVSLLDAEHMSSLAGELAKSGDYLGWTEIELELRDRSYSDAAEWLRDDKLRKRLDTICRDARTRKLTQPQS
jgi:hypothetical protein